MFRIGYFKPPYSLYSLSYTAVFACKYPNAGVSAMTVLGQNLWFQIKSSVYMPSELDSIDTIV
jgi:hypothetical protein